MIPFCICVHCQLSPSPSNPVFAWLLPCFAHHMPSSSNFFFSSGLIPRQLEPTILQFQSQRHTIPSKFFAVNCRLFWEYLRCAVTICQLRDKEYILCICTCHIEICNCTCHMIPGIVFKMSLQLRASWVFYCSCSSGAFQNSISAHSWNLSVFLVYLVVSAFIFFLSLCPHFFVSVFLSFLLSFFLSLFLYLSLAVCLSVFLSDA